MNCYERDDKYWEVLKEPYNMKYDDSPLTVTKLIEVLTLLPSEARIMLDDGVALCDVWSIALRKPVDESVKKYADDNPIVVIT